MTDTFLEAFRTPSFRLLDLKEKEIQLSINNADELCSYINKFLPLKFTTNHGKKLQNEEESENEELKENVELKENDAESAQSENSTVKTSRAKTIEELHKRIENLKGKRASYKERLLKKGLKNRLKKKQKLEERKQLQKNLQKLKKLESANVQQETDNTVKDLVKVKEEPIETDIKFNKFILSQSDNVKKQGIDPKSLLAKLEKKNLKLKNLELKGKKEKLTEIKSKEMWNSAIHKAEGVKVKDDVELLKRSVAKIKNRKNKSKKKWEEREKQLEKKKEDVQKKRQDNINKKKKERSKKRTKVLVKKGRILPK